METQINEYPSFNLNGEKILLVPGSRFSKNELKFRLKEMNIKNINSENKEYLNQLYDSSINDYQNCLKIIGSLKRDTNNMNSKLEKSQRQSMPPNLTASNNLSQNKVMNISYDVKNYPPNSREQQIRIIKPIHTNKGRYVQNPFISSVTGSYFNNSYNNNINNLNLKTSNNANINSGMNEFNNMADIEGDKLKNNNNYLSNNYEFNLEKSNISNINKVNNNSSFLSDNNNLFKYQVPNEYGEINEDINNKGLNDYKNNNIYPSQYQPEEKIQVEDYNNNNINENNNMIIHNNIPNYNQHENKQHGIIQEENKMNNNRKPSKRLSYQPNGLKHDINQYNNKSRKSYSSQPHLININEIPYNSVMQNIKNNESNARNEVNPPIQEEDKICESKNELQKESDEVSTFSLFSAFSNFKKYPLHKNYKFIIIHLFLLLIIIGFCTSLSVLLYKSWDSITSFISNVLEFLSEPKEILDIITSYFSSIILYPINYWYMIIPILITIFVLYFFMRKYLFKKRCKEIFEKIVKDLHENDNQNRISEDDICKRYSEMYGISYKKFLKKYLPQLRKLRRDDNRLKVSSVINKEKEYIFWELCE